MKTYIQQLIKYLLHPKKYMEELKRFDGFQ
jgi:hypothetical protein